MQVLIRALNLTTPRFAAWMSNDIVSFYVDVISYPCSDLNCGLASC